MQILYTALVFAGIAMAFVRFLWGPSAQDRLNAVMVMGNGATFYLLIHIFDTGNLLYADIVLLYTIMGVTGLAIFSFYLRRGD
jgi:multisubunit Na+/H+ antiporter MnhF subunit